MLPDFPEIKEHIGKEMDKYLQEKVKSDPLRRKIGTKIQHEGSRIVSCSIDGEREKIGYKSISSEFKINHQDIIDKGPEAFRERIDEIANDIIKQQSGIIFERVNEVTQKTGNVIDGKGKKFAPEMLLEMFKKMEIDFSEDGKPKNLTIVMHPSLWLKVKDKIAGWESDPKYQKKYTKIMEKKRREWIARENNRKLVD